MHQTDRSSKILARLIGYGWRHKLHFFGALLTMVASTFTVMVIPSLLGIAIDESVSSGSKSDLLRLALLIVFVSLLRGLFSYAHSYLSESVSQRSAFDLRNDIFTKLQGLSFAFHDKQQTGNLMSRATSDIDAVKWFMSMGVIRGLSTIVMFFGVSSLMLVTNWRLALICLVFVPIVIFRAIHMSKLLRSTWMNVQIETGHMTTVLQENLTGMKVVKGFGGGFYEAERFANRASAVSQLTYSATRLFASHSSLMVLIFTLATGVILWFGGREVVNDRLSFGELGAFILWMGLLAMPVRMIGWLLNTITRAVASGQRIFEILDAESPVKDRPGAIEISSIKGHVKFDSVSIAYDGKNAAIKDVEFEVQPGQLVAILGSSGSGKSTVVHLIPRFYEVTSGSIQIDGHDIRDIRIHSLRKNIGIVLQDVFVFGATVRDNIAYGVDNAPLEDVITASKIAQLHDSVESFPQGYDTWVGERGITLSGGQRQRLAIARTMLLNPPILILDDSTSSVDVGTEYHIQQALSSVIQGRTTFVIAHRLSTVRKADLILVLDKGRVVESGTHDDLLEQNGFYQRTYELQLKPQEQLATSENVNSSEVRQ